MAEVESRKIETGSRNIEAEIAKTLHPKPTWADVGDDRLNFYIAWAEQIVATAKRQLEALRASFHKDQAGIEPGVLQSQIFAIIGNAKNQAAEQLIIVGNDIDNRESRAINTLESRNEKPKLPDAELTQRWNAILRLLDAQPVSSVVDAMRKEASSDTTSNYLLRTRDALLYCAAKQIPLPDYYNMVSLTSGMFENDIQAAANEIIAAMSQREAMMSAWRRFTYASEALSGIGVSIFRPPAQSPIRAQEQHNGTVSLSFPDMKSFQEWARTPRI